MSLCLIEGSKIIVLPKDTFFMNTHDLADCEGRTCIVHTPTEHTMSHWPIWWRDDRGMFERICQHGTGHPDPDQRAYWEEVGAGLVLAGVIDSVVKHVSGQFVHTCCIDEWCASQCGKAKS